MLPDAQPRYAGYVAWRGTIDIDELSGRWAGTLLDAFTYRILPRGHLLTYPIPGPSGAVLFNWLWYQNIAPGDRLTDLLTDRNGFSENRPCHPERFRPATSSNCIRRRELTCRRRSPRLSDKPLTRSSR